MNKLLFYFTVFLFNNSLPAQENFIKKGTLVYEYKVNNHKNFGDATDFWVTQMKENTPNFSTYSYQLKFDQQHSVFRYTSKLETPKKMFREDELEDNIWYTNFETGLAVTQKSIFGDIFLLNDSVRKIKWKLIPGETREFAGFPCKKASAVLFDSVYVFAFYCESFLFNGGPMNLNGLPGTILGVTIPRLYMSCIATSYNINVTEKELAVPNKGKIKTAADVYNKLLNATKDWGSYGQRAIWQGFL
jgi:GLPGLI family protein